MKNIDKRGKLAQEVFTYKATKNGLILLYWQGKHIKTVKGRQAQKILQQLENADAHKQQLILAKATGHFKHGNEHSPRR